MTVTTSSLPAGGLNKRSAEGEKKDSEQKYSKEAAKPTGSSA
jgi:hypothetical protein